LKFAIKTLGFAIGAFGLGLLLLKLWLAPVLVEALARKALPKLWTGPLSIRTVELNFFAPTFLRGIELRDPQGRPWLSIGSLRLSFRRQGWRPILSEAIVDDALLTAYFDKGHCTPSSPMTTKAFEEFMEAPSDYSDLQSLTLRKGALRIVDESDMSWQWNNVALDLFWTGSRGDIRLSRFSDDGVNRFNFMGWIDSKSSEFNGMLAAAHRLGDLESKALLAALEAGDIRSADGSFTVNLSMRGSLTNWPSLEIQGNATVDSMKFFAADSQPLIVESQLLLDFMGTNARLTSVYVDATAWSVSARNCPLLFDPTARRLSAEFTNAFIRLRTASAPHPFWTPAMLGIRGDGTIGLAGQVDYSMSTGGPLHYNLKGRATFASLTPPAPLSIAFTQFVAAAFTLQDGELATDSLSSDACRGHLDAVARVSFTNAHYDVGMVFSNIDLQALFSDLQMESKIAKGLAAGRAKIVGAGFTRKDLSVKTQFAVESAALDTSPLFSAVLRFIGVTPASVQGGTDLACTLQLDWPLITIHSMRLANRIAAFEVQPGGTYDLETNLVDLYVVAGTLHSIHLSILIPFANLAKMLTRIHVKGNVSDPFDKLLHKEPVADLAKGTAGFLVDTVKTGGKLGQDVLKTLWSPFQIVIDLPRKPFRQSTPADEKAFPPLPEEK